MFHRALRIAVGALRFQWASTTVAHVIDTAPKQRLGVEDAEVMRQTRGVRRALEVFRSLISTETLSPGGWQRAGAHERSRRRTPAACGAAQVVEPSPRGRLASALRHKTKGSFMPETASALEKWKSCIPGRAIPQNPCRRSRTKCQSPTCRVPSGLQTCWDNPACEVFREHGQRVRANPSANPSTPCEVCFLLHVFRATTAANLRPCAAAEARERSQTWRSPP